jgi:hypothetical protein
MKAAVLSVALAASIVAIAPMQAMCAAPPDGDPTLSPCPGSDPLDASGAWLLDRVRMRDSSCSSALTDIVRNAIRRGDFDCTFRLEQAGALVHVSEICPGGTIEFQARVDPSGELRHSESTWFDDGGCRWRFIDTLTIDLGRDPTALIALYLFEFDAACGVPDCAIELTGRLRRVELATPEPAARTTMACSAAPDSEHPWGGM